jgi:hypothetical protein
MAGVIPPPIAITESAMEAHRENSCETSMTDLRSRVSANAPATNDSKKNGRELAVWTNATMSGDRAIVAMVQEAPTIWTMLPNVDISVAHQNSANARCSKGESVEMRHRANQDGISPGSQAIGSDQWPQYTET